MVDEINRQLKVHVEVISMVEKQMAGSIAACAEVLIDALQGGKKILLMGNGGSAADAAPRRRRRGRCPRK